MEKIDDLIYNKLLNKYGNKLERRDYYKLEIEKDFLKGKGKKFGIMFLVDVSRDYYIDINLYNTGTIKMVFRFDDYSKLITLYLDIKDGIKRIEEVLDALLTLVDENFSLLDRFISLSNGIIPTDIIRNIKIDKIIED
jgi:hypothetical protein